MFFVPKPNVLGAGRDVEIDSAQMLWVYRSDRQAGQKESQEYLHIQVFAGRTLGGDLVSQKPGINLTSPHPPTANLAAQDIQLVKWRATEKLPIL